MKSTLVCLTGITSIIVAAGATYYVLNWLSKQYRYFKKFRLVGMVSGLHCYPVSACSGMVNSIASCTFRGLKMVGSYDEQFVVGKYTDNTFSVSSPVGTVKQFFCRSLREIQAVCNGRDLLLTLPNEETFLLPLPHKNSHGRITQLCRAENMVAALDLGEDVAKWLNLKLKTSNVRLYQVLNDVVCVTPGRSAFGKYVFAVQESVEYINRTINMEPNLTWQYFRPNILISGSSPLDEINWTYIKIGNVCFQVSCRDTRIISTDNKAQTVEWKPVWELPPEVPNNVKVVNGCSFSTDIGVNAKVLREGEISLGDLVYASY